MSLVDRGSTTSSTVVRLSVRLVNHEPVTFLVQSPIQL